MSLFNLLVSKTIMHIPGPLVGFFARGYIAGEQLDDAVRVARELNGQGIMATIDVLGEFITNLDQARGFKEECLRILQTIDAEGLDANLSLKPTQMGLLLDRDQALANIREIVARAADLNSFVRIDMEDISCTDATLDFYRTLREEFPGHVGVVLQSYLRRTPADIIALSDAPMNFRLCKGIYNEPRTAAWKDPYVINRNYTRCLERIFAAGGYVGIATHDEKLVFEALRLIEKHGLETDRYEFQMLLGVDEELRRIIVDAGHRMRVYVPYGESWLPYSRRRLKENPSIAEHALRQMLGIRKI
ncbi:proline dehydrogenase [Geothermobacter hydrogeniphilus]|uniref:proline dehydrogenase n=1 Tax=Geothermobacter hydrogeniphilus TaxID=1969733 RepID=A0A2K2H8T8_9BACT|nr:proline dehydrogenase family protein [Geothermobacter hydrogeniphilus]PNU19732.1 proline dehydrogenase [Geothermobacter hydrogeniphilus]